ncbi:putative membrane-tethered transcription factor (SPT23) [Aspergillus lucknowensis]|uniref:IPT/TIG domain-containing protein n=1 Tax=Aspergillus lucknowensis TaxID=176173 RepID=A0ABR4LLU8_9EURO
MGPASSPTFPALDPIVVDDDMVNPYQDPDMDFLDPTRLQSLSEDAGQEFDDLFTRATSSRTVAESDPPCLSPSELSLKRSYQEQDTLRQNKVFASGLPAESPEESSPSSSSESPRNHLRNPSVASSTSAVHSENTLMPFGYTSEDWENPDYDHVRDESLFGFDASLPNLEAPLRVENDLESSNKAMDAAFDFESAASSPSPLKTGSTPYPKAQGGSKSRLRGAPGSVKRKSASPRITQTAGPFFSQNAKEAHSPFRPSKAPQVKAPLSPWCEHSPSSYLEESLGGINMNSGSPLNSHMSFSPSGLPFGFNFAPSFARTNVQPDPTQRPVLTVHPTSLKSRVETQIPIRLTLYPLPPGVKKIRLPSHTISKPKFLAPPATERSPEILELYTSLFCTSAMQDKEKLQKAFAKAGATSRYRSSSSSPNAGDETQDEEKPLEGGEVKICAGCVQRERKRAFRKKQRKPEEDELFQKHEEKRVIVFNTHEIKDWTGPRKTATPDEVQVPMLIPGAVQVELPMRIACYCRHQNEKQGFQVIFTLKDHKDNVIAQAITNSIMITDDHKTHAPSAPPAPGPSPSLPDGTRLPGVGVFPSGPGFGAGESSLSAQQAGGSPSATDLQGLQQRFTSQHQPGSGSFANLTNGVTASNPQSSRSLSRQASPNDFQGPNSKRRKHSNTSRLPSELTMTKLENGKPSAVSPGNESQFTGAPGFISPTERPFVTSAAMSNQFSNGPLTPTSGDNNSFFTNLQQQSLDNFIQQQLMSAPNSAHPSRPGTPSGSGRNSFQEQNLNLTLGPTPSTPMWPGIANAGNQLPSVIHKLVPAEGSVTGGTEVTLLGSGFYPGMEVVFGDTLATTTTYWGDKCLNCLTPPALQPGQVAVLFKHEHPSFNQLQQQPPPMLPKQQQFFRYVDDRELQMYRLALGILGQKLGNQADAFHTAQQIMGSDYKGAFSLQKDFQGSSGGHQRQVPGLESQGMLSDMDSKMLTYLEFIDLDDNPRPPRYNTRNATGQTLLHFASSLGLTRFVAGLLARGANPDVYDNIGNTPMHLAALNGHAHIVHRLRLAGASPNARSVRGFTPADLATTLPAHQAALIPARHHSRSRSVGSLTSRRRHSSSASLHSLWESSSASGSLDQAVDDSYGSEDEDDELVLSPSRRSSVHDASASLETPESTAAAGETRPFSPPAALVAWRNQLQAQINQFQQSVANAFPNLPNLPALPPMPALPGYQGRPMMRRITNLVPHRPASSRGAKEGWWDMLTGSSSPGAATELPSYDELYPRKESEDEEETARVKKSSMLQAAAEAALDQHFEAQAGSSKSAVPKDREDIKDIRIGRNVISREQQKHLREQQARRMKGLASDRNLYFFWVSSVSFLRDYQLYRY